MRSISTIKSHKTRSRGSFLLRTLLATTALIALPTISHAADGPGLYWDGSNMTPGSVSGGRGGDGTWNSANTNWTNADGTTNDVWTSTIANFGGTPGNVYVVGPKNIEGLTFSYTAFAPYTLLSGGAGTTLVTPVGTTIIQLGSGTTANDVTLFVPISGAGQVLVRGLGSVTFRSENTYTGGTRIENGTGITLRDDATLGSGAVVIDEGAFLNIGRNGDPGIPSITNSGHVVLYGPTTLGAAMVENTSTGNLAFESTSNAGSAIIANQGSIFFADEAMGTDARIGNGIGSSALIDVSGMTDRPAEIGTLSGGGTLRVGLFGVTVGHRNESAEFSGVIEDAPGSPGLNGLTKVGTGTLILSGHSTSLGMTQAGGGRLIINGSVAGDASVGTTGTLAGSGSIAGMVSVSIDGVLEGQSGQTLTMGELRLNGNATDSSFINVALGAPSSSALFNVIGDLRLDGTLNVTDAGGFGNGVYRIFDYGGTLTDNGLEIGSMPTGTTGTVQTSIASQVNLVVGGGTVDPDPIPTIQFWNGTTIAPTGTVVGGSGTWTAGPATNWTDANGTRSDPWNDNFAVFQGAAGVVTVDAAGVSTTGMQFAVDGYRVEGGDIALSGPATIRVGDGSAAGAAYTATIASAITGSGGLVKNDLGTLILTGANSYAGGTTIANGILQIGNGGTSGSITGNVLNNGSLVFNRSDATTFAGAISGSGGVQLVSGDLTFSGNNSYALGTSIASGATLRIGNGGASGSIAGPVANAGTLVFNRSGDLTFAGAISGNGAIRLIGPGKTELTGNSGGFAGATTVENGILALSNTLGGTLDVQTAGRLQGIGTVGDTVVSGTIAPGNSIGTLNVAGDITFNSGSIYEVEVNAAGQSDRIVASGKAIITGGTVQVLAGMGNYAPATVYTILTASPAAGGITGAFSGVTSNLAFLDPSLSYDASNVYLTMTRNGLAFQNVGITPNQVAAGSGVESLGLGNPVYDAVLNLSAPQARYAFDQLSGEIHASAKTAMIEDSRFVRNAVNDRIRAAFDGVGASGTVTTYVDGKPVTVKASTDRLAVWGQGFGSWGHTDGDGNAARLNRSTGGFFVGADAPVFDTWRLGAVAGYSRTDFDVKSRSSSGTSDNYHLGLYGGTQWGNLAFRTGAAYTWHDISTSRNVSFPGFGNNLKGDYNAATAQLFGELAYGFTAGGARFEPFANLAYVNLHTDGFTERGGAAALASPSSNTSTTFTTLGLRASTTFDLGGSTLTATGMFGWRHAFGDATPASVIRFAGGGNAFSIAGVPIARDAAVIEAGLDYAIAPSATLGVTYGGQFGSGMSDQSFRANFNVKF